MRATNEISSVKYLLIGSGRVARHLSHYFTLSNISFKTWDRAQDPHLLPKKVAECTHVLLAISDSALEGFTAKHLAGHDKTVVHFSGAKIIPDAISAHPLMTFGPELYDLSFYQKIHFTVTGASSLQEALPGVTNPFSLLPAEQKALYHAWCVMGGNFVTLLTAKMMTALEGMQIPADAVALYSQQNLFNVLKQNQTALTGPLARKDAETVASNLQALEGSKMQDIYQAFLKIYWPDYPRK